MKLSNATAVIRPRNAWEAIDLGFRMVHRDFLSLAKAWGVATAPWLIIGFAIALYTEKVGYAALLFWWLKPAFDRVLLNHLSHRLFSHEVQHQSVFETMFKIPWRTAAWRHLTYLRFSLARSFILPVFQLEGQRSKALSDRINTIVARDYGAATWLTFALWLISFALQFSAVYLLLSFSQAGGLFLNPIDLFEETWFSDSQRHAFHIGLDFLLFYIFQSVVEMFYVGAGFALYLNRRTHLEAWDIELSFRRLAHRLSKGSAVMILLVACLLLQPADSLAQTDNQQITTPSIDSSVDSSVTVDGNAISAAKDAQVVNRAAARKTVTTIEQSSEFGEMVTTKEWVLKEPKPEEDEEEFDWDLFDWDGLEAGDFFVILASLVKYALARTTA